ncbi:3294_t:CDS:2, partial [Gigaspora margarita]
LSGPYGDGGIDIFGNFEGYLILVQCKNYTDAKVSVDDIRKFEGVMSRAETSKFNILLTNVSSMKPDIINYFFKKLNNAFDYSEEHIIDEIICDSSQVESVVSNKSSLRARSFVWKYFKKKKNGSFAKCNFCHPKKLIKCADGSTSSLRRHLTIHKGKVPELINKELNISVVDLLKNQQSINNCPHEPFDLKTFKTLVKRWIVKHNYPFNIIEDE